MICAAATTAVNEIKRSAEKAWRKPSPEPSCYFFDALQAVPVLVVPFIELPFTVPV